MSMTAIVIGALLLVLGIAGFVATGSSHATALIPAGFGIVILLLGVVALKPDWRKHAMHAAAGVTLLGLLGTVPGVIKLTRWLSGETIERVPAVVAQSVMALLCTVFIALAVRSFIQARQQRNVQQA